MHNIQKVIEDLSDQIPDIVYQKMIRSGKEADVHLVSSSNKLMALKIYKDNMKYSTRNEYMPIGNIQDKRIQRAVKNRSKVGNSRMKSMWTAREFDVMNKLSYYLENIPKVYARTEDAILMEFIGDGNTPAPRLNEVVLTEEQARNALKIIVKTIETFIGLGIVHGDLTPYNILWFKHIPYIIDFPQVVEIRNNTNAYKKFHKDLENISNFFHYEFPNDVSESRSRLLDLFNQKIR